MSAPSSTPSGWRERGRARRAAEAVVMHIVVIPGTNREQGSNSGKLATLVAAEYITRGCSVSTAWT